ncbi:MAG: tetratricopeptide repeat protein [Anaerolineales bacterium]|nr:tetratricopeptide repeat protein [Anaerolineales bacterium]
MSEKLEIRLLGGLQLSAAGTPLTGFVSSKAPALLAYLAVTRRPHPRETLAALLWGGLPDADARNNLRQALSSLRRSLDPYLVITREAIAFNPAPAYFLDVEAFERGWRSAHGDGPQADRAAGLEAAAALYQGDFLAGFTVRDAPEFEDWLLVQRTRLRDMAVHLLRGLTQLHLQRGNAAGAIASANRLLALDAWREEAHRQLMLALARSGQRAAALAQYENCRRLLAAELNVQPAPETAALYERIRAARRRVHLPPAATPFVGRSADLANIAGLLADPTCRLLTLVGPSGSGKTRLALEAAARAMEGFLHGVCFVSLAGAGSVDTVPNTIAETLKLPLTGKADPCEQLLQHLRDRELLLVLDNLEHLAGAPALVGALLDACREARLIATSRERLNLHGERLVELDGLAAPPDEAGDTIERYEAAQLFLTAARAAQPAFAPSSDERRAIARICRLVAGLPLAIELAAAWVRHLRCDEIAEEIGRNLNFLATTQHNLPARHRSLRAAFEHSWTLLNADERSAFPRLGVFRGGCDRDAALAVTGSAWPVLAALCDKSLVRRDAAGRYGLHELLRQFAESKLQEDALVWHEARTRHRDYYLDLLSAQQAALSDGGQIGARQRLMAEIDNIRLAWQGAVAEQQVERLAFALEGLRLFLEHTGWYAEAVSLYGAAAEAERARAADGGPLLGRLLARMAWFQHRLDDFAAAQALIDESLPLLRRAEPRLPSDEALCLLCQANIERARGDFARSKDLARQGLALQRQTGDPPAVAAAVNALAAALTELGEFDEAEQLHEECLALRRELGDRRGAATTLVNLGFMGLSQGRYADSQRYEREALTIFRDIGYPMGEAVALNNLGVACQMLGEHAQARATLTECVTLCRDLGHRHIMAHALGSLGGIAAASGELEQAWRYLREALQTARAIGSISATLFGLVSAAEVLARQGQPEYAAEAAALVVGHSAANRETKNRAETLLACLEAQGPAPLLEAARARGSAGSPDALAARILVLITGRDTQL